MPPKKLCTLTTPKASRHRSTIPQISDGKRLRRLWFPSHGDGDPSPHIADRSLNLARGHPTWKVFCGSISLPITRPVQPVANVTSLPTSPNTPHKSNDKTNGKPNSKDAQAIPTAPIPRDPSEPPRHVYLDDHAAYTILASSAYTHAELRTFWPFDFDNRGGVKAGRGNRGRAAVLGLAEGGGFATWGTQGKARVYIFCGGGDILVLEKYLNGSVGSETVEKGGLGMVGSGDGESEIQQAPSNDGDNLAAKQQQLPPKTPLYNAHIPYTLHQPVRYTSGPTDGTLKPLGIAARAVQSSPYFEEPCAQFRARPRSRPGDLAARLSVMVEKRGRDDEDGEGEGGKRVKVEKEKGKGKAKNEGGEW